MKNNLNKRLSELRQEYEKGMQMLDDLRRQQAELEQTLLRIAGAIQVLEELSNDVDENQEVNSEQ